MLNKNNVSATIAVRNLDSSSAFYENKLGLEPIETDGEHYITYKSGNSSLLMYQSRFAGGYKASVATWTVGQELEALVKSLKDKGVVFKHYDDMPDTTRIDDIYVSGDMKNAWVKDPDGNILSFVSA